MARIPDGWTLLTSDVDEEQAWATGVEFKQARERIRDDVFVRVRVVRSYGRGARAFWILTKEEERAT